MAVHILLMTFLAPVLALAARRTMRAALAPMKGVLAHVEIAAAVQLAMVWAWHAPPVLAAAHGSHVLHVAMQATLLASALWFWASLFAISGNSRWRGIVALLFTSKIFCLLGILFLFAPRALYPGPGPGNDAAVVADQQAAGLLMLVACPAAYVLTGIVIAAQWFGDLIESDKKSRAAEQAHALA
jgi:putative membrane protein